MGGFLQQSDSSNFNQIKWLVYATPPGFPSPTEVGICDGGWHFSLSSGQLVVMISALPSELNIIPPNSNIEILITLQFDPGNRMPEEQMKSLGWALIQHDWCPYEKGKN